MKTLHLVIVSIIVSIGFFFGASMFLPFPYGLVIGIAFPVVMMYYSIRNPEKEKIDDSMTLQGHRNLFVIIVRK
jgi:hypothetical protein